MSGGKNFDKFLLLMWKNFILQYRKPLQTAIEILAPVLFSMLLVVVRSLVNPEPREQIIYKSHEVFTIYDFGIKISNWTLLYSPMNNTKVDEIMKVMRLMFNVVGTENIENYYVDVKGESNIYAGIDFNNVGVNDLPKDMNITIRFPAECKTSNDWLGQNSWSTHLLYPVFQTSGPRNYENTYGGPPGYYLEGFLTLQHFLTYTIILEERFGPLANLTPIELISALIKLNMPRVFTQRFPYPDWTEDMLVQVLQTFVALIIMLSFVYPCINTVKVITTEKEKQLKEAMKIMGLPNWLHWLAWFVKTFILMFISVILIVVLLKVKWYPSTDYTVFTYADSSVLLVFLVIYICATITLCFAVSVFFSKANTAATIAGLVWFLSQAPHLFMENNYDVVSTSTKLLCSLGSNTAMAFGFQIMVMYEGLQEGIQWSTLFTPASPDDTLTVGSLMLMLIVDTFLYLFIALYFEAIFPGEYGVPQPWYFPFTYYYWTGKPIGKGTDDTETYFTSEGEFFEKEPGNLLPGIKINNLRKVFGKKVAVSNLTLNMYENQITVLLGHNGAGKTTTMSMLTGIFPPTSGRAVVAGHDIRTDMTGVRNSLGLCPQHNILFDDLTVVEHLYFYSKLKGLNKKEIPEEIDKYVSLLELVPKANSKSSTLSGGMKRKLCVGMAMCGKSKVVMLDEPTAGMDPSARRALWELVQSQKEGRTILLTTHFMDEADLLGDRIAIMSGGELECCGSSFFLKKKYGAGYHLIMEKAHNCDTTKVTDVLKRHLTDIQIHSNIGSELTYLLTENQSGMFESMLKDLEENGPQLGVCSYGISLTTLEEVFMKVGADHSRDEINSNTVETTLPILESTPSSKASSQANILITEGSEFVSTYQLIVNQFLAMFMKKILSIYRTWILLVIQILMPLAFLIITILVSKTNINRDLPLLPLNLDKYETPITTVFNNSDPYTEAYLNILDENNNNNKVELVTGVQNHLLNVTRESAILVRKKYLVGATSDGVTLTAWFNNDPLHTAGQSASLLYNAIYKVKLGNDHSIIYNNYPFPFTAKSRIKQVISGNSLGFQMAFNIGFSMAFVSSFYVLFCVRERVCKSKHLQFASGVNVFIFWISNFICDFTTYLVTVIMLLITLAGFQEDGFRTPDDIGRMFLILLYFGWSMLPMLYLAAYLCSVPATGFTRMTLFSIFTGVAIFLIVQVMKTANLGLENIADILHWIFLLVPHYSLCSGIYGIYTTFSKLKMCSDYQSELDSFCQVEQDNLVCKFCKDNDGDYFKWAEPGIGRNLTYSTVIGSVLFILVLLIDFKAFSKISNICKKLPSGQVPPDNDQEDDDVMNERQYIRNTPQDELLLKNTIVLKDVTKFYKSFLAVNKICLSVKDYECFGLLGINGAGKTTTFRIMTGDLNMSHGEAWVNRLSINDELKEVQKLIGYCPQFDALLDDLTARESITMYALLRGLPLNQCAIVASSLARNFDFSQHLDKKIKELSGGNKRKVSTSIALIGDPAVVYLDEPTTGMDPATKRYLWNALCQERDKGKCIVLTSHSMEECEALCTRLAIMVNGSFKCLGSVQHLKNKFAAGYTLTIKIKKPPESYGLKHPQTEKIEQFISSYFPEAVLREKHQELLTYYITHTSTPWSKMFGILEFGKRGDFNIEDYSLGQSSLEQVFLSFTKAQNQDEEGETNN